MKYNYSQLSYQINMNDDDRQIGLLIEYNKKKNSSYDNHIDNFY
jgi:hypothetical protein